MGPGGPPKLMKARRGADSPVCHADIPVGVASLARLCCGLSTLRFFISMGGRNADHGVSFVQNRYGPWHGTPGALRMRKLRRSRKYADLCTILHKPATQPEP